MANTIETTAPTPEALLDRARAMAPRLKERVAEAEKAGRVPAETIAEMLKAGLFRVAQPTSFGGYALATKHTLPISYELAQNCASTGWLHQILGGHARNLTSFPMQGQQDVWGADPDALVSSAFPPTGLATPVEGGYRLSGAFPFSSGCDHASWAIVGANVPGKEIPAGVLSFTFLVPFSDIEIEDDWQVMGMCATGSKTLHIKDAFVPAHRTSQMPCLEGSIGLSTVAAGIAQGAVTQAQEHIVRRRSAARRAGRDRSQSEAVQIMIAESAAEAEAAWLVIQSSVEQNDRLLAATDGLRAGSLPLEQIARNLRNISLVVQLARKSVERLYAGLGGSALYTSNPLQRSLRDVYAVTSHIHMSAMHAAKQSGRIMLGLEYTPEA